MDMQNTNVLETKLDFIIKQIEEMRMESKEDRENHRNLSDEVLMLKEKVSGHTKFLNWLAGIVGTTIASLLSALGIAYFIDKMK